MSSGPPWGPPNSWEAAAGSTQRPVTAKPKIWALPPWDGPALVITGKVSPGKQTQRDVGDTRSVVEMN